MHKKILLPVLLAMLSSAAHAGHHYYDGKHGWTPYLGLNFGYSHLDTDSAGKMDGMNFGVKGVSSFQSENWFFDPALGLQGEQLTGSSGDFFTLSGVGELDARYKFSRDVSFGPMTSIQFGGNQSRNGEEDGSSTMWLGGGRLMIQQMTDSGNPYRLEFNIQRSISGDADVALYTYNVGVQFGFPWEKEKKCSHICPAPRPVAETPKLRANKVGFDTDSAEVEPTYEERLSDLTRVIKARENDIELIRVEGHADERGSMDYNQDLSERRAKAVKEVLIQDGIQANKIQTKGYGETKPIDPSSNERAWSKNRRTDVKFYGLKKDNEMNREEFKHTIREASDDME